MKAVIFDLDGTIVDSAPGIAAALKRVGTTALPVPLSRVRELVALSAEALVSEILRPNDNDLASALSAFRQTYAENPCCPADLFPGALKALEECRRHGLLLGVCTNKPQALAEIVLSRLGAGDLINVVVGATSCSPKKPHPQMLFRTIQLLGAQSAVFVGDTAIDADASARAGLPFIFTSFGYGTIGCSPIPAAVVDSYNDLPAALCKIWPKWQL